MNVDPENSMWHESLVAYERLRDARDDRSRMLFEAVLEDLYAQACERGDPLLREFSSLLDASTNPIAVSWRALLALHQRFDRDRLQALEHILGRTPARSRWLISAEMARLSLQSHDAAFAWQRIAHVEPVPAMEPWLDEGPLAIHAFLVALRLAAATGHWDEHDRLADVARARFGHESDARVSRVQLARADHDVMRGRYERAMKTLDSAAPHCRGDLEYACLAVKLHALVACASEQRDTELRLAIDAALGRLKDLAPGLGNSTDDNYRLPADERADLVRRVEQLAEHAGSVNRDMKPEDVRSLADALAVERQARAERVSRPPLEILARLVPPVESLLSDVSVSDHPEAWFKLRLLWCRLVVDLAAEDRLDACEEDLTRLVEETTRLGLVPLTMSAYDQRAVLYAQARFNAWDRAVADAGRAGTLAVELLSQNASPAHETAGSVSETIVERALLGTLLPVFDRVIDLLIQGASIWESDGGCTQASWNRERRERWRRFGRAIHDYVEQSQALALKEARRAYGVGDVPIPHRFVLAAPDRELESPLPSLQAALRAQDAVLQYFVTGRYVVVFCYTATQFDWVLVDAVSHLQRSGVRLDAVSAHTALSHLSRSCKGWLEGENSPEHVARAMPLVTLLLPDRIVELLADTRVEHVRLVPHDVLYRLPFGRFSLLDTTLVERFSLSMHPTAGLAAESADHTLQPRGRRAVGYVFDPDLGSVDSERARLRAGLGRLLGVGTLIPIDTTESGDIDELVESIRGLDVLHLACHGTRPVGRREALLSLGMAGRWKLSQLASLHMRHCTLAILQSCWTGWMEHERTNPVQGFPQAFCDAGVAAVIAPLVKVPDKLTPIFAEVFYRTLRFLPAERALWLTLDTLRERGARLLADDKEALRDWRELGPHDTLDYRYIGHTGLRLHGGFIARLVGRISFWWWLRASRAPRGATVDA